MIKPKKPELWACKWRSPNGRYWVFFAPSEETVRSTINCAGCAGVNDLSCSLFRQMAPGVTLRLNKPEKIELSGKIVT